LLQATAAAAVEQLTIAVAVASGAIVDVFAVSDTYSIKATAASSAIIALNRIEIFQVFQSIAILGGRWAKIAVGACFVVPLL
jgi:hypothetical protein